MGVTFINPFIVAPATSSAAYRTGATTMSYTSPSTVSVTQAQLGNLVQSGDFLLAYHYSDYDQKTGSASTLPSGFTEAANNYYAGRHYLGWKIAGGSEGTYTTQAGVNVFTQILTIIVVSGATALRGNSFTTNSATTATMASVTASAAGLLVAISYMQSAGDRTCPTWSTPMTSRISQQSSPITYMNHFVGTESVTAGATGTRTSTASSVFSGFYTYGVVVG